MVLTANPQPLALAFAEWHAKQHLTLAPDSVNGLRRMR